MDKNIGNNQQKAIVYVTSKGGHFVKPKELLKLPITREIIRNVAKMDFTICKKN
jgi:hypothetical protein